MYQAFDAIYLGCVKFKQERFHAPKTMSMHPATLEHIAVSVEQDALYITAPRLVDDRWASTIWGIPVIEDVNVPENEVRLTDGIYVVVARLE